MFRSVVAGGVLVQICGSCLARSDSGSSAARRGVECDVTCSPQAGPNCSETDMSKLWEFAKRGDADGVGELLDAGADPNDPDQAQQPVRPWSAASECSPLLGAEG